MKGLNQRPAPKEGLIGGRIFSIAPCQRRFILWAELHIEGIGDAQGSLLLQSEHIL